MKKLIGAFILTGILFTGAQAQRGPQPKDRLVELKKELSLSDEQAVKVEAIFSRSGKEIDSLRKSSENDRENSRKLMAGVMEKSNVEIQKLLNDDQKAKYKKIMESRKPRHGKRMPPPPDAPRDGEMNPPPPPDGE